jgi:acetylornithine deacetylase/succinyl-diaminopimelate desuccinylase-like protein
MTDPLKNRVDYLLQEWVNTNTHTDNRRGVRELQDRIEDEAANLGLQAEWVARKTESESDEPNHLLRISNPSAPAGAPLITLVSHVDTVFPEDSAFQLITWASGRKRAIGPGAIHKGGILTGLMVLENAQQAPKLRYRLELLVLPSREAGSPGFEEILREQGQKSAIILGLEPALPNGSFLHSRGGEPAYDFNPESDAAAKIAIKLIEHHEKRKVAARMSPEASGCNFLYREGIPVLDGLGPVGTGAQSSQETVEMPSIFTRADILVDLLENLVR